MGSFKHLPDGHGTQITAYFCTQLASKSSSLISYIVHVSYQPISVYFWMVKMYKIQRENLLQRPISTLDANTAEEIQHILLNPPTTGKYESLKNELNKTFGKSQFKRDSELLNINGLGDTQPSALLRKINALNNDPQTLKRAIFLEPAVSDTQCTRRTTFHRHGTISSSSRSCMGVTVIQHQPHKLSTHVSCVSHHAQWGNRLSRRYIS